MSSKPTAMPMLTVCVTASIIGLGRNAYRGIFEGSSVLLPALSSSTEEYVTSNLVPS